ncbi:MAG: BsaWI family type II restriction enzyme [Planctomycetaceae bacterium]|jgi:type II restriction enzyme|nr:BsaWI family type II restriction enzyme [Planctomycetaceae bacterium]
MYELTKAERKILDGIKKKPYMKKTIDLIESFVRQSKRKPQAAYKNVFDEICRILYEAKDYVDSYLADRKIKGVIRDEKQAMKPIAGNSFSQAIIYTFLKNKELGNINTNIFITSKPASVPSFDTIAVINVDNEAQKPDCDLVIYSLNEDASLKKCMILSLKTSLRERAGQTYKWKLLMEIAMSDCAIKEKYHISYNPATIPLVCFATVNFYDEINNPQHRGMFKFFDRSFIAKKVDADFITKMSCLPDYINEVLL